MSVDDMIGWRDEDNDPGESNFLILTVKMTTYESESWKT
jgi:hypothetical protein